MSFMFHPYPYADPRAVNHLPRQEGITRALVQGSVKVAEEIAALAKAGSRAIGIDGFPGAPFEELAGLLSRALGPQTRIVDARSLLRNRDEIRDIIADCLPQDRDADPVLLYGKRFEGGYGSLQDVAKVNELLRALRTEDALIVIGQGALCEDLRESFCLRLWLDITPRQAVLNFKNRLAWNLGEEGALPYAAMMRRNYYVDFELAAATRWSLIREDKLHYYISADDPQGMSLLPYGKLCELFDLLCRRPLRCRPVYLEGVWGGFYMKRLRKLPEGMRNCAWIFDMIPMEVSLAVQMEDKQLEVPFFTFIQQQGEKLLGKAAMARFGGYFPIRFNYDDTFHSSGNMSIQCHPGEDYVVKHHRELGRQDESYYVCVAGEGAKTYLGFRDEGSCEGFLAAAQAAQETGEVMAYERFLHAVPSKPGTQIMIPAGTIHASGHNQVVLEIGSLTVGSYTYKLYDYQRTDPQSGLKRPIHLRMGSLALRGERTKAWVESNLVNHGGLIAQGEGWQESAAGEHDLLYFSLRTLHFDRQIPQDTRGCFHVLALTEGEKVRAEKIGDPSCHYTLDYLDIAVIPASVGAYRLINLGAGPVTVHKTTLKDETPRG